MAKTSGGVRGARGGSRDAARRAGFGVADQIRFRADYLSDLAADYAYLGRISEQRSGELQRRIARAAENDLRRLRGRR